MIGCDHLKCCLSTLDLKRIASSHWNQKTLFKIFLRIFGLSSPLVSSPFYFWEKRGARRWEMVIRKVESENNELWRVRQWSSESTAPCSIASADCPYPSRTPSIVAASTKANIHRRSSQASTGDYRESRIFASYRKHTLHILLEQKERKENIEYCREWDSISSH